jgi:shikimate kinase
MKIFLLGFMGSGKSYLGKLWAANNNLAFYDLDKLIEEEERMTIENIFSTKGEDYFREREAAILRNTERYENAIIACGGGTPCFFDNMHWMQKNGVTVFLNQSTDNILLYLINEKSHRPLIASYDRVALKNYIIKKLEERLPFYNRSNIILSSEQLNQNGFTFIEHHF